MTVRETTLQLDFENSKVLVAVIERPGRTVVYLEGKTLRNGVEEIATKLWQRWLWRTWPAGEPTIDFYCIEGKRVDQVCFGLAPGGPSGFFALPVWLGGDEAPWEAESAVE